MMITGSRLRQIGWMMTLVICTFAFVALTFRVNAVKSQVRLSERRIISLEQQKRILQTEFETRANQQQLANWNKVEFGYSTPKADQYLENERQLAQLGAARGLNAPSPIRVAHLDGAQNDAFPMMVSPLTGQPIADEASGQAASRETARPSLAERLSRSARLPSTVVAATVGEVRE